MKKIFTLLLLCIVASAVTSRAEIYNGTCGNYLTWSLNTEDSTLVIEGTGSMSSVPWSWYKQYIAHLSLPEGLTGIYELAFSDCRNLTSVTLPSSITYINYGIFSNCRSLTSINIPYGVTGISAHAFEYCYNLTAIEIPNTVTEIGYDAFTGCISLISVLIPNSVTSIGENAFGSVLNICYSGSAEGAPWGAKNLNGFVNGYLVYTNESKISLVGCGRLATGDITIPNSVTSIGNSAFSGCTGLSSITIPNSVINIGNSAFSGCIGLSSITIPNSVTSIGDGAFNGCTDLTNLSVLNNDIQIGNNCYGMFIQSAALKHIAAPACIFDTHSDYTNYPTYFPQKLDSIEVTNGELSENALWLINLSRKSLKHIDLSGTTHADLADEAFKEFYNLQTLILPSNLTHVGYKSIAECVKLKTIDIPASVEEIDDRAFEDCRSIETITFGGVQPASAPSRSFVSKSSTSQLHRIGNWAFYNAHELQHLEIPEGVTEIGDGAFYGCVYLEDLVLPSSVQQIGDNCFALCAKLDKIVINSVTPPTIAAKTFYDVKRQIPVYVPDDCVGAYKGDPYWGEFDIQGQSNMPQGIDEIIDSKSLITNKVLKDGCILILRGDKTYTLTGAEVK